MDLQFTEGTTWDGKRQLSQKTRAGKTRLLYVVKFRPERSEVAKDWDDVSPEDAAKGVKTFKGWDNVVRRSYRGHDTGTLHTLRAPAVLTWDLHSGDEIVHIFTVHFWGTRILTWVPEDSNEIASWAASWEKADCDPVLNNVLVSCDSTPGRGAMLGEDTLDAAFGNDALRGQIEAALMDDDWRMALCSLRYTAGPGITDTEGDVFHNWHMTQKIEVKHDVSERV